MIALIFCGGYGSRMNNGQPGKLKPLLKVGGKAVLRHIISIYQKGGVRDFILLGGYKIDELQKFASTIKNKRLNIKVVDTGEGTPTGGRLLLAKGQIPEGPFYLTYGDSLTNYSIAKSNTLKETTGSDLVASVYYKALEYGVLDIDPQQTVKGIFEKTYTVPINAGFYTLDHRIFDYIHSVEDSFEIDTLPRILKEGKLKVVAYPIDFWHPMDTPADRKKLDIILKSDPSILYR